MGGDHRRVIFRSDRFDPFANMADQQQSAQLLRVRHTALCDMLECSYVHPHGKTDCIRAACYTMMPASPGDLHEKPSLLPARFTFCFYRPRDSIRRIPGCKYFYRAGEHLESGDPL